MTRIVMTALVALGLCQVLRAVPPAPVGTATTAVAGGITPGGRGPARPRGDAFPLPLPAKGQSVELVRPAFPGGPGLTSTTTVDVALLGKSRPVHVRIVTRINGQPVSAAWDNHLASLFRAFDRNADGYLNRYEFDYAFSAAGVAKLLHGKAYVPYQDGDPGPDFVAADRDKDGRVSPAELRAYYSESVKDVLTLEETKETEADSVKRSQALFELLDRNKDGVITADECRDGRSLIQPFDKNDDESLSPDEIPVAKVLFKPKVGRIKTGPGSAAAKAVYSAAGTLPDTVLDSIIGKYDRNKDGTLTLDEVDRVFFGRGDRSGDGILTRDELAVWRTGPPDIVVVLTVGAKPEHCTVGVEGPGGAALPNGATAARIRPDFVVLRADGLVIEFRAPKPRRGLPDLDGAMDFSWPTGKPPAAVRENELANQNQIFRVMFDHMDANGDGRVTFAEHQAYVALQRATAGFPVTVTARTRPIDLFPLLDENGDGRLSARELRAAYDKLLPLEPSGGPGVTPAAMAPAAAFGISQPAESTRPGGPAPPPAGAAPPTPVDDTAPLWFRKMDLNNDGDLSKKEFLGSAEHFKRLDTNGDGVIGVEEAKAYEAARKK